MAKRVAAPDRSRLKVWLDGRLVPYDNARVPILSHPLQYGSGIFEGLRAYEAKEGTAVFRLADHMKRFMRSTKIYSMKLQYGEAELRKAVVDTVRANHLKSCYIRPYAFYNSDAIGINPYGKKVSVYIAAVPFGAYFGGGRDRGIRCKVSSWRRINSDILPVEAKASGNYINSIIAGNEAKVSGFDEAILLSQDGYVAEGPGENIFLVRNGGLVTPDASADILMGITRESIISIAEATGLEVEERETHKEELYTADEVFFCGTAAEVTPITNIDGMKIGSGKVGPITKLLAGKYSDVVQGKDAVFSHWLTYV